jgi:hypothetical protein
MTDCSICCEKFNKSNRCKIKCKTCEDDQVVACQSCAKRYILDQPTDPSCMMCKVEWDTEFLTNNFTNIFISKELKVHRENYLLDKQIALLPETQEYAEQLKLIDGLEKQKIIIFEERRKLELKLRKLNSSIREIDITIGQIRNGTSSTNRQKNEFTFKCPVEHCNGFLNSSFNCGICDNKICKHCMEIKEDDTHECDEEKKKTVEYLKKDTKPCPKCGEFIHKINGCDQMYCITCHTAFSWRTGVIERGNVHNPEYYRWMRENGRDIPRDPLDVRYDPCGNQVIDYTTLLRILRELFPPQQQVGRNRYGQASNDNENVLKIANMHRMVHHINFLNNMYQNEQTTEERLLRNMRAMYLLNKITKEDFKKKLQMSDKKKNKNKKINDIWNVVRLGLIEYIGKITEIQRNENGKNIVIDIVNESKKIRKYCNNSFAKIGKMFKMTYPGINHEWIQIHNWDTYIRDLQKRKQIHLEFNS